MTEASENGRSPRRRDWMAKVDLAIHVGFWLIAAIALVSSLITGRW